MSIPPLLHSGTIEMDILELAKDYLAKNAAESGADEIIRELVEEVRRLRKAPPYESPTVFRAALPR